jgi:hypothetical protein
MYTTKEGRDMPDMRLVIAMLMGMDLVGMVLCVPWRAVDMLFTLVWVGVYLVLGACIACVWEGDMAIGTRRTHGVPMPNGRAYMRLVTPDYQLCVAGSEDTPVYAPRYITSEDVGLSLPEKQVVRLADLLDKKED